MTTKQQTIGSAIRTVVYGYNTAEQLTQITTPSGQAIGYGYTNNRITSVTVNGATLLNQVLYEPFGPTRGWTWGNGTLAVRDYNTDWQLVTIDSAGLSTHTFFPDGAIQTRTDDNPVPVVVPNGTTNYTLATTSNRLASSAGVQARTYGYDAAGNTTSYAGAAFTYNDAGRMVTATSGGVTTSYLFNALGQRVRKSNASSTRIFGYDERGRLTGEYDQSGNLVQETVWLDDIAVATLRPNGASVSIYYVHTDHLSTPRRITRPSDNAILWRWESDPFGQAAANEDVDGDGQIFGFNLRFPGQYFDGETGLNYNYHRDYDPVSGRYVQSDPIGLGGSLNTYAYAAGNPISYIDPSGLAIWKVIDAFEVGMVAGVGGEYVNYKLQSPCNSQGKRYTITVQAVGPSAGLGLKCKVCWTSPAKVPFGGSFDDHSGEPDPNAFSGPYLAVNAGAQFFGFGGGYGDVLLGRATSGRGFGFSMGAGSIGAEVSGTIGTSTVTDVKTEDCECNK